MTTVTYECAGKDCTNTLKSDRPTLANTGWALLFGVPKGSKIEKPMGLAICNDCTRELAERKRLAKNKAARERRRSAKALDAVKRRRIARQCSALAVGEKK